MKKKEQKNAQKPKKTNDFASLDSELGSFGLEPPKRYRQDESQVKQSNKQKKNAPKTTQQKRTAQKKKRKRSKLFYKIISILAIVIAIVGIVVALSLTVFFKIDTIKVNGNQIYTVDQITAVLPIDKDKNLFMADTKGAENKLESKLPYIYNADIKRKFPSTIVVNITETPKVYAIRNENKTFTLIDQSFKVLETNVAKRPENSVIVKKAVVTSAVVGETIKFENDQQKSDLENLINAITDLKLDEITSLYSIDVNSNYMVYNSRITFKFGTTENLENKIYACLSATEKLTESDPNAKGTMTATDDKQIYFTEK